MDDTLLNKIIEILKDGIWIKTASILNEISLKELNYLIREKFVHRIVTDNVDIIDLSSKRLKRLLKLKNF